MDSRHRYYANRIDFSMGVNINKICKIFKTILNIKFRDGGGLPSNAAGCSPSGVSVTTTFPTSFSSTPEVAIGWTYMYFHRDIGIIDFNPVITTITKTNFVISS
jgi:hypothetical protein